MRILAIRGSNLASLPEFSIDFTAEPLAGAGLFAITGRTGAGKSTILDALCLALFDKTPRLAGGGASVSRGDGKDDGRVNAGDVRSIVRQGTSAGSAEVDFVGHDGKQYRASWQARRARGRADGKFQPQTVSLIDINSNQPLGGTKTETLSAIQEKLGLTYDQFKRSVLLAQGDFAAFLQADGKDRAELLEKITGTDIYARLSIAAFARRKSEEQALELLRQQLGNISLLSKEEIANEHAALKEIESLLKQSGERLAELERFNAWYSRKEQLMEVVQTAELLLVATTEQNRALLPMRERLYKVENAERFRPLFVSADHAENSVKTSLSRRDELANDLRAAVKALETRRITALNAAGEAEDIKLKLEESQPAILKARELDIRLKEAKSQLEVRNSEQSNEVHTYNQAVKKCELADLEIINGRQEIASADAWFNENKRLEPVVSEWERWRLELKRYSASFERIKELSRLAIAGDKAVKAAEVSLKAAVKTVEQSEKLFAQASTLSEEAEKDASMVDLVSIRQSIDTAQSRQNAARELRRIAEEALKAVSNKLTTDKQIKTITESLHKTDLSIDADRGSMPAAIAARDEAERSARLARATLDLEGQRDTLQDGDPCPLCGSCEHPYRKHGQPGEGIASTLETRSIELREAVTAIESRIASGTAVRESLAADLRREQQTAAACAELIEKLNSDWLKQKAVFGVSSVPESPSNPASLDLTDALQEKASASLMHIRDEELRAAALLKAVAPARSTLDTARAKRDKAIEYLNKVEYAMKDATLNISSIKDDAAKEKDFCEELQNLLSVPFKEWDGWLEKVQKECNSFIAGLDADRQLWTEWSSRRTKSVTVLDDAIIRAGELKARRDLLKISLDAKRSAVIEQQEAVNLLSNQRLQLFDGISVEQVEKEFQSRLSLAMQKASAETSLLAEAEKAVTSSTGKLEEVEKLLASSQIELEKATALLNAELSQSGVGLSEIRELLAVTQTWREDTSREIERSDMELRDVATRLNERRQMLEQHILSPNPTIEREALIIIKEEEALNARELEDRGFSIRHRLTADATSRKNAEDLLPKIESQQKTTRIWQEMGDLIGSSDGKKFRSFAQSLTLDLLLGLSNQHLASLSNRFSLMRVPFSEMDLQVIDREMGDDIRSVNCISGGESFLVSLSLALGLSSLASGTTRIGSLFIDEGFGSLDLDTLDTALSSLDALQATGRIVGIISHVSGLTEKIGTRIEVISSGGGTSRVTVHGV